MRLRSAIGARDARAVVVTRFIVCEKASGHCGCGSGTEGGDSVGVGDLPFTFVLRIMTVVVEARV